MDPVSAHDDDPVAQVVRMMHGGQTMAKVPDASSGLGPRLREIRLERGISLRELARRLDLSPSSISQIETGKMQPSVRTLYAFAAEFGVTVDEVLFEHGAPLRGPSRSPDRARARASRCSARRDDRRSRSTPA